MSKYRKSTKFIVDVYAEEKISPDAVAGARYAFKYHNARDAEILALGYEAYRDLMNDETSKYTDITTYQGLKIYHDPNMIADQWAVRYIDDHVDALEKV